MLKAKYIKSSLQLIHKISFYQTSTVAEITPVKCDTRKQYWKTRFNMFCYWKNMAHQVDSIDTFNREW